MATLLQPEFPQRDLLSVIIGGTQAGATAGSQLLQGAALVRDSLINQQQAAREAQVQDRLFAFEAARARANDTFRAQDLQFRRSQEDRLREEFEFEKAFLPMKQAQAGLELERLAGVVQGQQEDLAFNRQLRGQLMGEPIPSGPLPDGGPGRSPSSAMSDMALPDGSGDIDTALFDGGGPAVTRSEIPDLKTTWFDRTEPGVDSDTARGVGAFGDNKLSPNAIALSDDVAERLQVKPGALIEYTLADGTRGVGTYEDAAVRTMNKQRAARGLDPITGRVDLFTADKQRVGVDQPLQGVRVLRPGVDGSGRDVERVAAENIALGAPTSQGPAPAPGAVTADVAAQTIADPRLEAVQAKQDQNAISVSLNSMDRQLEAVEARLREQKSAARSLFGGIPQAGPVAEDLQVLESQRTQLMQRRQDEEMRLAQAKNRELLSQAMLESEEAKLKRQKQETIPGTQLTKLINEFNATRRAGEVRDALEDIPKGGFGPIQQRLEEVAQKVGIDSFEDNKSEFIAARQAVANLLLRERSGAAVTDQEFARFLEEVGNPKGMSEEELRRRTRIWIDGLEKDYALRISSWEEAGFQVPKSLLPAGHAGSREAEQARAQYDARLQRVMQKLEGGTMIQRPNGNFLKMIDGKVHEVDKAGKDLGPVNLGRE